MKILEHVSLKEYTTFKAGGPARFFIAVTDVQDLKKAVLFAREKSLSIFILGGGSNILISDAGFSGVVIKLEIMGIQHVHGEFIVGAGENWDHFVEYTVSNALYGLENLSYIPGTVGAAPVQNIGAYGVEVQSSISWVEVVNTETLELEIFSHEACGFSYRESIFKKPGSKKYIITRVAFSLSPQGVLHTEYKDVAEYIRNNNLQPEKLSLRDLRNSIIDIRTKKLPDISKFGTAGSFFKNPTIEKNTYEELLKTYPDMPAFPSLHKVKIPAGWLLDKLCGFKGYRDGAVGVYKNQALVLVNFGGATSTEIISLAEKMSTCVQEKTGIILEREVQIIF